MRPDIFGSLVTFNEALARILAVAVPITRTETVPLARATARVAAGAVSAPIDVPAFDRAAMDGYAVRARDTADAAPDRPSTLRCTGVGFTGLVPDTAIAAGECREIATGAPLPDGADAVVMVEHTTRQGDVVTILRAAPVGQHVGRRGSDVRSGQLVLRSGDYLRPAKVGALAAIGATHVDVFERPRIAVFSTGNELAPPGAPLPSGHVYDVNRFTLQGVIEQHGGITIAGRAWPDEEDALTDALRMAAQSHDVVVCSGGSSVGGRDLLVDAMRRCGRIDFHGIAVKPGKPTLFGSIEGTPVFGMPGNPTSCLSNAYLLLVPFVRALAGLPAWRPMQVSRRLATRLVSPSDRHQFFAVRLADDEVHPAFKSSGDITSLASADGYIEIPTGVDALDAGTLVTVTMFD